MDRLTLSTSPTRSKWVAGTLTHLQVKIATQCFTDTLPLRVIFLQPHRLHLNRKSSGDQRSECNRTYKVTTTVVKISTWTVPHPPPAGYWPHPYYRIWCHHSLKSVAMTTTR